MSDALKIKGLKELNKFFKVFPIRSITSINKELAIITNKIKIDVQTSMRNTTKDKNKGVIRGRKHHFPSKVGHPPAVDKGNLIDSIYTESRPQNLEAEIYVWGAPYIEYLEDPEKLNRPSFIPAVERANVGNTIMDAIIKGITIG
jgi:hypothetical protein